MCVGPRWDSLRYLCLYLSVFDAVNGEVLRSPGELVHYNVQDAKTIKQRQAGNTEQRKREQEQQLERRQKGKF